MTDRISYKILAESRRLDGVYDTVQRFPPLASPQAEVNEKDSNKQTARDFLRGMMIGLVVAGYTALGGTVAYGGYKLVTDAIANVTADLRIIGAPQ